jgi:hypothetical protein
MNHEKLFTRKLFRQDSFAEFTGYGDTVKVIEEFAIVFMNGLGLAHGHAYDLFTFRFDGWYKLYDVVDW